MIVVCRGKRGAETSDCD